jgi:hypothetical protein
LLGPLAVRFNLRTTNNTDRKSSKITTTNTTINVSAGDKEITLLLSTIQIDSPELVRQLALPGGLNTGAVLRVDGATLLFTQRPTNHHALSVARKNVRPTIAVATSRMSSPERRLNSTF